MLPAHTWEHTGTRRAAGGSRSTLPGHRDHSRALLSSAVWVWEGCKPPLTRRRKNRGLRAKEGRRPEQAGDLSMVTLGEERNLGALRVPRPDRAEPGQCLEGATAPKARQSYAPQGQGGVCTVPARPCGLSCLIRQPTGVFLRQARDTVGPQWGPRSGHQRL